VVAHLPDQPHIARIDPFLWRRLLAELLTNAVRYARSAAGTGIVVRLVGDARRLTFSVADDGIGIAPDDLPHVTELFYRGVNVQNLPGSGIGLAIVKRIVDLNGGDLEIDSTMVGGTTVTIVLPIERTEAEE
jgi:signal transduction histidine kinase